MNTKRTFGRRCARNTYSVGKARSRTPPHLEYNYVGRMQFVRFNRAIRCHDETMLVLRHAHYARARARAGAVNAPRLTRCRDQTCAPLSRDLSAIISANVSIHSTHDAHAHISLDIGSSLRVNLRTQNALGTDTSKCNADLREEVLDHRPLMTQLVTYRHAHVERADRLRIANVARESHARLAHLHFALRALVSHATQQRTT
jgi:hypothetical protein